MDVINNLALVFPGQGSQRIGMLADAAGTFPSVASTFEEASEALGYDLWSLIQDGEAEALNMTETTQPALLASSVALWRAWQASGGPAPACMAGHSLGEFSALVCAGAIAFADALRLVRTRGAAMQEAVPLGHGAMAAVIGLDDAAVDAACRAAQEASSGNVAAVNYNSPGQVVIAGLVADVNAAADLCKEAGAKRVMPLPVSAPFHTTLMQPAGDRLAEALDAVSVSSPEIPVVHNVHADTETDPTVIKSLLVKQIYSPVRWTACVTKMIDGGVSQLVECGPGKVLTGLGRRIDKTLNSFPIETPEDLSAAIPAVIEGATT